MVPTYDHRRAWKLHHCGVTPLWCRHTTTCTHGHCTTVALHRDCADIRPQACMEAAPLWRYTTAALHRDCADIRPQACMEAAPLWRYTAMVQTYDHRHARRL